MSKLKNWRTIEYFGPIDKTLPKYLRDFLISDIRQVQVYQAKWGKEIYAKFKAKIAGEDALFLKLTTVDKKFRIY